jgi:hypothetical protein
VALGRQLEDQPREQRGYRQSEAVDDERWPGQQERMIMTVEKAKAAGVCCALERNATCGRPLRKGKCRVHGDEIHQSFTEHHRPTGGSK